MPARTLPLEAWLVVAVIAWFTVRQCLGVLERYLAHGLKFRRLVRDIRRLHVARLRRLETPAARMRRAQQPADPPEAIEIDVREPPAAAA